jgi:hypothetical protein
VGLLPNHLTGRRGSPFYWCFYTSGYPRSFLLYPVPVSTSLFLSCHLVYSLVLYSRRLARLMASHPRPPLSRLNIPGPPSLEMQQPMGFDPRNQSMFSPGLPTSIQQGFHPPFSMNGQPALQTPMQPMFAPQPPGAPNRPLYAQHRVGQLSIAQLAAAGIHPPNTMPMTPLGQGFSSMASPGMPFGGSGSGFQRNRRAPSVNLGGPPKAVLGGPNRKVSPLPLAASEAPPAITKAKKAVVKFPRETVVGDDKTVSRSPWARTPLPLAEIPEQPVLRPPELATAEVYPTDSDRYDFPNTLDVFLPGKVCFHSSNPPLSAYILSFDRAPGMP